MVNTPVEVSCSDPILAITVTVIIVVIIVAVAYLAAYTYPRAKIYSEYLNVTMKRYGKNVMKISYEEFLVEYYSSQGSRCNIETWTTDYPQPILIIALKPSPPENIGLVFSLKDYHKVIKWHTNGKKVPKCLAKTLADAYDQYDQYMETTYHEKDNGD